MVAQRLDDLLVRGQAFQSGGGLVVQAGQGDHRAEAERFLPLPGGLELVEGAGEPARGLGQQARDLARQGEAGEGQLRVDGRGLAAARGDKGAGPGA